MGVFLGCTALVLAPWLIHNYAATGQVALDAPFQYRIIASQYRYTGNLDIQNVDLEGKSIGAILTTFALRDPGFVFGFIANHALATQVGSVLALPRFYPSPGLLAGVEPYWADWSGSLDGLEFAVDYSLSGNYWARPRVGVAPIALVRPVATGHVAGVQPGQWHRPLLWMALRPPGGLDCVLLLCGRHG